MLNPRPPLPPAATTLVSAVLRDCQLGNAEQSASAGPARIEKSALVKNEGTHFWMDIAPLPSSDGKKGLNKHASPHRSQRYRGHVLRKACAPGQPTADRPSFVYFILLPSGDAGKTIPASVLAASSSPTPTRRSTGAAGHVPLLAQSGHAEARPRMSALSTC